MAVGRYLGVGLACAILHNVVMIAGDLAGWHYVASSFVSLVVVTVFGYLLHSRWTFPGAERYVLVDLFGLPVPIAAPVVTVVLFAFNFTANRWALRVRGS